MNLIVGIVILFGCVLGGYVMHHGQLGALYQPTELLIIGGGAFGAFFIAHPIPIIKKAFASVLSLLKGSAYNKSKYMELLALMYALFTKIRKDGLIALEADIENPDSSPIFSQYPGVTADHHVLDFICDYFRLMVGGSMNAFEIENLMDVEMETHHEDVHKPIGAVQGAADALPAFGIIAAVLGVVITMGAIGGPPEELGRNVGARKKPSTIVASKPASLLTSTAMRRRLPSNSAGKYCLPPSVLASWSWKSMSSKRNSRFPHSFIKLSYRCHG
jgi:chemotaxis protein MotA